MYQNPTRLVRESPRLCLTRDTAPSFNSSTQPPGSSSSPQDRVSKIVGGTIGGFFSFALLAGTILWWRRRQTRGSTVQPATEVSPNAEKTESKPDETPKPELDAAEISAKHPSMPPQEVAGDGPNCPRPADVEHTATVQELGGEMAVVYELESPVAELPG
jgi:hypothetical protein